MIIYMQYIYDWNEANITYQFDIPEQKANLSPRTHDPIEGKTLMRLWSSHLSIQIKNKRSVFGQSGGGTPGSDMKPGYEGQVKL